MSRWQLYTMRYIQPPMALETVRSLHNSMVIFFNIKPHIEDSVDAADAGLFHVTGVPLSAIDRILARPGNGQQQHAAHDAQVLEVLDSVGRPFGVGHRPEVVPDHRGT